MWCYLLVMNDAVVELGKFATVPAIGGADEIASDALQAVDVVAVAFGALGEVVGGILVAAIHTAVSVMVYRAISHVVAVHQVDDIGNGLGVVRGIAIDFDVEDVSASCERMVRTFNFSLMFGTTAEIDWDMI